jgi:mannose-6-phosphate isomerase-like protein (cupin superfamily)
MKIDVPEELTRLDRPHTRDGLRHRMLRNFQVDGGSTIGVARLERSASPDHWEVHDDGDELLFVISGTIGVEVSDADGKSDWQTIGAGQCMVITRGAAHAVNVLEDAAVLFMTPCEGSRSWKTADVASALGLAAEPS